jgi:hypothetical protein
MKRTLILWVVLPLVLMASCFAQPTVLTCTMPPNGEAKLTFDEAAGTASFYNQDSPSRATFTEREIKWVGEADGGYKYQYTLSRMTGTLTVNRDSSSTGSMWHCEDSQKKF